MPSLEDLFNRTPDEKLMADVPANSGKTIPTGIHTVTGNDIQISQEDSREPGRSQLSASFQVPDAGLVYANFSLDPSPKPNRNGKHVDGKVIIYFNILDPTGTRGKEFGETYKAFKGADFKIEVEEVALCTLGDLPRENALTRELINSGKKNDDKVYPVIPANDHKLRAHLEGVEGVRVINRVKGVRMI